VVSLRRPSLGYFLETFPLNLLNSLGVLSQEVCNENYTGFARGGKYIGTGPRPTLSNG
jgi:hypothetical protein